MKSSKKYFIQLFLLVLIIGQSCTGKSVIDSPVPLKIPTINISNMHMVDDVKVRLSNDTLTIEYIDKSFIYDEKYNSLKSNKLIYWNRRKLDKFDHIVVAAVHKDYQVMGKYYSRTDMKFIQELYQDNPKFNEITDNLVCDFDLSEIAVLKHGIKTINEIDKIENQSYIDLVHIISRADSSLINELPETNRLRTFYSMIETVGFKDAWSNEPVDPTIFLLKISRIFRIVGTEIE